MMKTKIKRNFSNMSTRLLASGLVVAVLMFVGGFTNSLTAQTATDLGTQSAKDVISLLDEEQDALEYEFKVPPQGANLDLNIQLKNMYKYVEKEFIHGGDLGDEMVTAMQSFKNSANGSSLTTAEATTNNSVALTPAQKQELNQIIMFVKSWGVSKNSLEDLTTVFDRVRNLKNQ